MFDYIRGIICMSLHRNLKIVYDDVPNYYGVCNICDCRGSKITLKRKNILMGDWFLEEHKPFNKIIYSLIFIIALCNSLINKKNCQVEFVSKKDCII